MRAAMFLTDILIVPYQTQNFEVWALTEVVELIEAINTVRPEKKIASYAVLNLADANNSAENQEAAKAVEDFPILTNLPTLLKRRKAFSLAIGVG
jgi:chromosome partitioning protein